MNLILIKSSKKKVILKKIKIIEDAKAKVVKSKQYSDLIKKYKHSKGIIDGISIRFCEEIDTTAKTINGEICLSTKLLSSNVLKIARYIIHELTHVFQHIEKEGKKQKKKGDYLKNPDEVEAFQYQFDFQEDYENNLEKYINDFFEFHKVKEKDKAEILNSFIKRLDDKSIKEKVLKDD